MSDSIAMPPAEADSNTAEAGSRSLDCLLRPRSVAVIGASATPGSFGNCVLGNLESAGYPGQLYLVNPKQTAIGARRCFRSVTELPEAVDCAILAIPRAAVVESLTACAQRGVRSAILFSAGFAESGEAGRAEQDQITLLAAKYGMVIEGPNCLGMVNYVDSIPLTFVATPSCSLNSQTGVAIISQSGAMAAVLGVSLKSHGLDITFSISTGNEAATSVEDYLEYLIDEQHTRVFVMIVEQFRHPRRFLELAERARDKGKHIVLLHPGRSDLARTSAITHTGALTGEFEVMQTCVEHAGVLLVETIEELLDTADILMRCPALPNGGACVLAESGAFKALALDFCERVGLELPTLGIETESALRQVLPDFIPVSNPLDITAHALVDTGLYSRTLPLLLADTRVGSLVLAIILTDKTTSGLKLPPILSAIRATASKKPIVFAGLDEGAEIDTQFVEALRDLGVPFFPSPERALRALACVTQAAERRKSRHAVQSTPVRLPFALPAGVLPEYRSKEVLAAAGIPIPKGALARTVDEAQEIAAQVGFPVALKAQSASLSHKSDVGGVILNVANAAQLSESWEILSLNVKNAAPDISLDGILVEQMCERGVELIAGIRNDPQWGPLLLIGSGGVLAEALKDIRLIPPDLNSETIAAEILRLKFSPLLRGFRGSPAADIAAAAQIVRRLGDLALSHPEIREADINPIAVYPEGRGAVALDALLSIA
jgi:acetate---CoA ligase (ADP-forming)